MEIIKSCSRCTKDFPLTGFVKDDRFTLGVRPECRLCYNADRVKWRASWSKDKRKLKNRRTVERHKERYHSDPEFRKYVCQKSYETMVRREYELEPEEVIALSLKQNNACAICLRKFIGKPHIDHIKDTKIIRGLLCGSCNRAIGMLQHSPKILQAAANYVERGGK